MGSVGSISRVEKFQKINNRGRDDYSEPESKFCKSKKESDLFRITDANFLILRELRKRRYSIGALESGRSLNLGEFRREHF